MPNRVVREGINDSPKIDALVRDVGWEGESFYRRLLNVVDDYGCFDGRVSFLRARCFPTLLELVREADLSRWIAACVKSGLVRLYTAGGKEYLEVLNFGQFTRQKKRKHPPPPPNLCCNSNAIEKQVTAPGLDSDSVSDSDSSEGNGDARGKGDFPPGFCRFWAEYPGDRKADKEKCREKWDRAGLEDRADAVLAGLAWWKNHRDWKKQGGEFICAPLVFLNQTRWQAATDATPAPVEQDRLAQTIAEVAKKYGRPA